MTGVRPGTLAWRPPPNPASKPPAKGAPWTVDCQRRSETWPARRSRSRPMIGWRPENLTRASFETGS